MSGGRLVGSASRLGWVRFPSVVSRVISLSAFLVCCIVGGRLYGSFALCFPASLRVAVVVGCLCVLYVDYIVCGLSLIYSCIALFLDVLTG